MIEIAASLLLVLPPPPRPVDWQAWMRRPVVQRILVRVDPEAWKRWTVLVRPGAV